MIRFVVHNSVLEKVPRNLYHNLPCLPFLCFKYPSSDLHSIPSFRERKKERVSELLVGVFSYDLELTAVKRQVGEWGDS